MAKTLSSNARNPNALQKGAQRTVRIEAKVNGNQVQVDVSTNYTLAELLREKLGLTGTKLGCNRAECGVCTVLVDDTPVFSCTVLAVEANGSDVETVEGLSRLERAHLLQEMFVKVDALQCGFCTPGLLMSLKPVIERKEPPTIDEIRQAIAGNYCRCGAYPNIFRATVEALAEIQKRNLG